MNDIREIASKGYCAGCGACAVACPDISMQLTDIGTYIPTLDKIGSVLSVASSVCPFSDTALNEDELARRRYDADNASHNPFLGFFNGLYAGQISAEDLRLGSSSGGLTSWFLAELLRLELVDGVIHVGAATRVENGKILTAYTVSSSVTELLGKRKSRYYPHEFSRALASIRGDGKRYAIVGLPCFIKAARLLAEEDSILHEQLSYFVGLVCGHLKSARFAEFLAWQMGVNPSVLDEVDFRIKEPGLAANEYSFGARSICSTGWLTKSVRSLYGADWGLTFFQLRACDFCDDIFSETADICFGDAWLPEYLGDWKGTNVVLCRTVAAKRIVEDGISSGSIVAHTISENDIIRSQAGTIRHRRDGLSVRLDDAIRANRAVPRKRIMPGSRPVSLLRRWTIRLRALIGSESHKSYQIARRRNSLCIYNLRMLPLSMLVGAVNRVSRILCWLRRS